MTSQMLLMAGQSRPIRQMLHRPPFDPVVTGRFIGGPDVTSATAQAMALWREGKTVTVHYRGDPVRSAEAADQHVEQYAALTTALAASGVAAPEISLKLEQLGLYAPGGVDDAVARAVTVTRHAYAAGVGVTLDMEGIHEVDRTLAAHRALRAVEPDTGIAVQAYLRRTEQDCVALAESQARVRLVKGCYAAHGDAMYPDRHAIDRAYVRCLSILMHGSGRPMLATHDDRLIRLAAALAQRVDRDLASWEVQMLQGIRAALADTLVGDGVPVRIYVPYGPQWYSWFARRLAEKPSNLALLAWALIS